MRALLRLLLVLVVIVVAGFLLLGAWTGSSLRHWRNQPAPVGTSGAIDTQTARERGAEVGEKAAQAANKVEAAAHDAALTTKIKAKMALDDTVKARAIDVSTDGTTVTLSGRVDSAVVRDRAVALARETDGVTSVVDNIVVR